MDDMKRFIAQDTITVSEAMQRIDQNSGGILFLTDESGRMKSCITDGDIRRFLLSGGGMDGAALAASNRSPRVAKDIEEAKKLYDERDYVAIPVLSASGVIEEIYDGTGEDKKKKRRNPLRIPVVINAGGRGTRLDPYTKVLPKPLIPVGDMPIIEHIMKEYQSYSCDDFHIIVNYKGDLVKAYFSEKDKEYQISWYDEKEPLDTGGGLSLLKGRFSDTFFFANCDALLTANYESMIRFHKENENVITMVCAYKNINIPYGVIEMGKHGVIEKMKEKPLISFLANTGIYIVEPEVAEDLEDGVPISFPDIIEMEREKGKKVAVFPVGENDWMDMGQMSELEKMRKKLYGY